MTQSITHYGPAPAERHQTVFNPMADHIDVVHITTALVETKQTLWRREHIAAYRN